MTTPYGGLPTVDRSLLPAEIRSGSRADQRTYAAALGFERMLLAQLTKSMAESAQGEASEDETAASSAYRQMLPDALADAVIAGGGIGFAGDLHRTLKQQAK